MEQSRAETATGERTFQRRVRKREVKLHFADVTVNLSRREVVQGGVLLHLTPLEFELMALFLRHPRNAFTREELCEQVWGRALEGRSNHVDVAIMGLRRKLEAGGRRRIVHTLRGYGYVLREAG